MYQQESDELVLSIGEIIQYEDSDGEVVEGEVIDIAENINAIRVMPVSQLLRIPVWIHAEDILSDENIEFVLE